MKINTILAWVFGIGLLYFFVYNAIVFLMDKQFSLFALMCIVISLNSYWLIRLKAKERKNVF